MSSAPAEWSSAPSLMVVDQTGSVPPLAALAARDAARHNRLRLRRVKLLGPERVVPRTRGF
jgi:hypothetical protein